MPAWPTQSDYKDSLQNPDTAFRDPDLCASAAERSPMGVPRARSGAFASVYKMTGPKGVVALKLFNFPNEDRALRYKAVSDYLEKDLGPKKPPCVVKFQYHLEGIRVGKGWYPTLTMAWVKGVSLGEWVRQTVEKKNPDVAAMRKMAESWAALVQQLQDFKIAHGDLQHDNVMVVADQPVLVDYDGMCVPALDPADPKKKLDQLEFGKPAYQHPARSEQKLSLNLDHFAAWVILVAMRAVAADPQLYVKYVLKTENENLLFSPQDMQAPASSALWPDLMKCKDAEVAGWARVLRESLDRPFDKIPPFSLDPFVRLRKLVAASPRDWPQIEAEADRLKKAGKAVPPELQGAADPVGALKELCDAARKDWPAILSEGDRLGSGGKALPPELKRAVEEARRRVAARDAVRRAADAGDPRAVVTAYKPDLIDDWADRALVGGAKSAAAQVALLDQLKAAAASPGDGSALVKLWQDAGPKLAGVAEARRYEADANAWKGRIRAAGNFILAFSKSPPERDLADAWNAVLAAGAPHASLTEAHRARGEEARRRAPVLDQLRRIPAAASHANDSALAGAWGTGAALAGCAEAVPFAERAREAGERLALVKDLERAIREADAGGSEEAVLGAAEVLPLGYEHPHKARVAEAAEALTLVADLRNALEPEFPSDRKTAAAYDRLRAKNPKLAKRLNRTHPELFAEAEAALSRRKLLDAFAAIDAQEPRADRQDEKWQALWKQQGKALAGRRDREELRARLTLARDRMAAWGRLREALDAKEMFALRKRVAEYATLLDGYPPLAERRGEVRELLQKADRIIAVQQKLDSGEPLGSDDLDFLRRNHPDFGQEVKRRIEEQVRTRLGGEARPRAQSPGLQSAGARGNSVRACWSWGGHGLISYCLIAIDGERFLDASEAGEKEEEGYCNRCDEKVHQSDGGGFTMLAPSGAAKAYVTVWPVVELGWTDVVGEPLKLGPVALKRSRAGA